MFLERNETEKERNFLGVLVSRFYLLLLIFSIDIEL